MSPNDKKRNDRLISLVTIFLLVPLTIVVAIFLATEIQINSKTPVVTEEVVEKGRVLTMEELAQEKELLPKESVPITAITASSSTVTVEFIDDKTADEYLAQQPTEVSSELTQTQQSFDPTVKFTGAEVTTSEDQEPGTQKVLEGYVYKEASDNHFTIIVENVRTVTVTFLQSTPIFINGKRILASDLALGDFVRVEGVGQENSISASSVTVMKTLELNI